MVMTVSNVRRMSKTSEVGGKGPTAAATPTGSTDASPEVVHVEEETGVVLEGATRGCLELTLI